MIATGHSQLLQSIKLYANKKKICIIYKKDREKEFNIKAEANFCVN